MDKDSISWTERVFCSSIIDFIWFVLTVLLTWMHKKCFMHVFNVFIKVKNMFFYFFYLQINTFNVDDEQDRQLLLLP